MQNTTLLVLAAGMGSRYGGLKQIDPVGPHEEKIIDYCIYDAIRAGFKKVVFVIRRDIEEAFKAAIGQQFQGQIEVAYAFQEHHDLPGSHSAPEERSKPWGTGQAVWAAREVIDGPFGVVNADDFYGAEGFRLLQDFLASSESSRHEYVIVTYNLRNTLSDHGTVSRGICTSGEGHYLNSVTEHLKIERRENGAYDQATETSFTGDEPVSMNMWGFTPEFFDILEAHFLAFLNQHRDTPKSEFLLPEVVDAQIQSGAKRVRLLNTDSEWFGVTYPEDKPLVEQRIAQLIEQGQYPTPLW